MTNTNARRSRERGFALVTVMVVLGLLMGLTVTAHLAETRIGGNDYAATRAFYAAEAGAEYMLASLREQLYLGSCGGMDIYGVVTVSEHLHQHRKANSSNYCTDQDRIQLNDSTWTAIDSDTHDHCGSSDPDPSCCASDKTSFVNYSENNWDNNIQTEAHGIQPLTLPVPDGTPPHVLVEPCSSGGSTWSTSDRDVIELDLSQLDADDYGDGIVYASAEPGGASPEYTQYVVRVRNGADLQNPLTISTALPMYVQGDYSTQGTWQPASLAADALTILSNSWQDDNSDDNDNGTGGEYAFDTEIQAAILAGHTETPSYNSNDPGGQFENFPPGTPVVGQILRIGFVRTY